MINMSVAYKFSSWHYPSYRCSAAQKYRRADQSVQTIEVEHLVSALAAWCRPVEYARRYGSRRKLKAEKRSSAISLLHGRGLSGCAVVEFSASALYPPTSTHHCRNHMRPAAGACRRHEPRHDVSDRTRY